MDKRNENKIDRTARSASDTVRDTARDAARDTTRATESTTGRMASNAGDNLDSGEAGRAVGEGVGGIGGLAAGAAIGSLVGPIGTVIGAVAGAVGGWWAGREVAETAEGYTSDADTHYRNHFESEPATRGGFSSYDQARPLYQLGYVAAQNPDYAGRSFADVEPDLRRGWTPEMEKQYGSWDNARGTVSNAYDSGRELRMTRAEEELVVGKRQVRAGEVGLKKTVETEHVSKSIPLMHEEVEVERHAVGADSANRDDLEIGDKTIRIPLTAEEAVVQKRVVAKEEVVVSKHAVEGTKEVDADLRRERIDVDKQGRVDPNRATNEETRDR